MKIKICLLAGVVALILCACGVEEKENDLPSESAIEQGSTVAEEKEFTIDENGKDFLHSMCYYMPDWEGADAFNDQFWEDFLFASFTGAGMSEDGKASTICGEAEYITVYREDLGFDEGEIKVSRDAVAQYVKLALGCELPEFEPSFEEMEPRRTALYYKDGYYYIGVSDFGAVSYVFNECEAQKDAEGTYALVRFDIIYDDPEGETLGAVIFTLRPEENQNGFIITGKETKKIRVKYE